MAQSIAAYTMYGFEWLRADVRAFWGGVAARLRDAGMDGVPARLTWKMPVAAQWTTPNLLLAQTCGYPLMKGLTGPVRLVATPSYVAPFVEGASYRSLVVVARGSEITSLVQLQGGIAAINTPSSHSGYNALRRLIADYARQAAPAGSDSPDRAGGMRFFRDVVTCGCHYGSLGAVAAGKADVAAIDAVSFHLISRHQPGLTDAVRVLTTTLPAPGLPLITAADRSDAEVAMLRTALMDTLGDKALRPALVNMAIDGFQILDRAAYGGILDFERQAEDMGYPVLA